MKSATIITQTYYWDDGTNATNRYYATKFILDIPINKIIVLLIKFIYKYCTQMINFRDYIYNGSYKLQVDDLRKLEEKLPKLIKRIKDIGLTINRYSDSSIKEIIINYSNYQIIIKELEYSINSFDMVTGFTKLNKKSNNINYMLDEDIKQFLAHEAEIKSYWAAKTASTFYIYGSDE